MNTPEGSEPVGKSFGGPSASRGYAVIYKFTSSFAAHINAFLTDFSNQKRIIKIKQILRNSLAKDFYFIGKGNARFARFAALICPTGHKNILMVAIFTL